MPGRTTNTPISEMLISTRAIIRPVARGIVVPRPYSLLLCERPDEGYKIFDLVGLQTLAVGGHLVPAALNDGREFRIALFLDVRGSQVAELVSLAHCGLALTVGAMTSSALRFE